MHDAIKYLYAFILVIALIAAGAVFAPPDKATATLRQRVMFAGLVWAYLSLILSGICVGFTSGSDRMIVLWTGLVALVSCIAFTIGWARAEKSTEPDIELQSATRHGRNITHSGVTTVGDVTHQKGATGTDDPWVN